MKKLLLSTLTLLYSLTFFPQTEAEIATFTEGYDPQKTVLLKKKIERIELTRTQEIEEFIAIHKINKSKKSTSGTKQEIKFIVDGLPVYQTTFNEDAAKSTRTNYLHFKGGLGLNLEGQNMTIGIWDGEVVLASHQEFLNSDNTASRVTIGDGTIVIDDHATHVGGTLISKGIEANAEGMAPKASLISYDWDNDTTETITEYSNGLLVSNYSYGIPVLTSEGEPNAPTWMMGCYDDESQIWDEIAYNAEYSLPIFSAGNSGLDDYDGGNLSNSGYDKLTGEKNAKNNLVVANANPSVDGDDLVDLLRNPSSSQGPSDDGRVKPDIAADGTGLYSSISTGDTDYDTYTGTSMAAPNATGTLILLQQYYNELNAKYMKSATLKGLVCHTALDDGLNVGPDPIFGWGLLDARKAVQTIEGDLNGSNAVIIENTLTNGQTYTYNFTTNSSNPIKATICWTDPAGTSQDGVLNSTIPALVNDLDLRITDSHETPNTYFPWKLQTSDVSASAIKGDNLVDNVEKIEVSSPTIGSHSITVTHKGTLDSPQNFSLIFTGSDTTLHVEKFAFGKVSVWPNPVSNLLNYSLNSQSNTSLNIRLYDIQGREIYSEDKNSNNLNTNGSINTTPFSKGIYILKISQDEKIHIEKVIIE